MAYVFEPASRAAAAIVGTDDLFPVRRIFCVGQNYADHVKEMGGDASKPAPFFFCKPADALVANGAAIPFPGQTDNLHHEIELVVAIGKGGADIKRDAALQHVFGYGVGVDLTRRDRQAEAKEKGRPWDVAKGFDRSAPLSALTPASKNGHPAKGRIWLAVDGATRQDGDIAQMIWPVPDVIAFLSKYFELQPGDLIYTGTPSGVGPLKRGDKVEGGVEGLEPVRFCFL